MSRGRELFDFYMLPYHDIQWRILGNYYIDENNVLATHGVMGGRNARKSYSKKIAKAVNRIDRSISHSQFTTLSGYRPDMLDTKIAK